MSKYTPGSILSIDSTSPRIVLASGNCDTIDCPVFSDVARFLPTEQRDSDGGVWTCLGSAKANASLFLAASDLLEACQEVLNCPPRDRDDISLEARIEAAVRKAIG